MEEEDENDIDEPGSFFHIFEKPDTEEDVRRLAGLFD